MRNERQLEMPVIVDAKIRRGWIEISSARAIDDMHINIFIVPIWHADDSADSMSRPRQVLLNTKWHVTEKIFNVLGLSVSTNNSDKLIGRKLYVTSINYLDADSKILTVEFHEIIKGK